MTSPGVQIQGLLNLMLIIGLLLTSQSILAAVKPGINLTSDSETVYFGDSIIIEVEAVGIVDELDISPLFKGADLLRETAGTRIAVIDERVVEVKVRRMEFLPRREGRVFFGPLQADSIIGPVVSNTLIFDVQPPVTTDWTPDQDDLQLSLTLSTDQQSVTSRAGFTADKLTTYIGQRIIFDIEIRHRHPITEEDITLPSFKGFDVLTEFEERRTLLPDDSNDKGWRLTSWRYHLFAQHSGIQSIGKLQWSGTAIRSRTQRAAFDRSLKAPPIHILAALQGFSWWLPASDVSISDTWSKDVRTISAGDEFLRTITLEARDVLSNHLPVVEPLESRAITSTLISQKRTQQLAGDHIQAQATYEFRMVAQSPIPVFLDTVRIVWFDTVNQQTREAIIPARRINVGLPDRADLLADLALHDSFGDKWLHKVRVASDRFAFWHVSLAVLGLIFLSLVVLLVRTEHPGRKHRVPDARGLPDL